MKWHEVACSRCDTPLEAARHLKWHMPLEVARHLKWHTPLEVARHLKWHNYATRSGTPLEGAWSGMKWQYQNPPHLLVLCGFMHIVRPIFLQAYRPGCLQTHSNTFDFEKCCGVSFMVLVGKGSCHLSHLSLHGSARLNCSVRWQSVRHGSRVQHDRQSRAPQSSWGPTERFLSKNLSATDVFKDRACCVMELRSWDCRRSEFCKYSNRSGFQRRFFRADELCIDLQSPQRTVLAGGPQGSHCKEGTLYHLQEHSVHCKLEVQLDCGKTAEGGSWGKLGEQREHHEGLGEWNYHPQWDQSSLLGQASWGQPGFSRTAYSHWAAWESRCGDTWMQHQATIFREVLIKTAQKHPEI